MRVKIQSLGSPPSAQRSGSMAVVVVGNSM
jgi:hypothetical protein